MSVINLYSIKIDTCSADEDGRLILSDNRLVGVAVRLEGGEHGGLQGYWSLEAGFGPLEQARPEPFISLEGLKSWVDATITELRRTRTCS
jgi:hypothetical protein